MRTYMSLFSGISPQRSAARAAFMAQVSVARLGHLPHLVPHSLALADIAGRALTKSHNKPHLDDLMMIYVIVVSN